MEYLKILEDESNENWLVADGYLFLFDGEDLTGEHFTSKTDSDSSYTKSIGRLAIDGEHELKFTADYPGEEALGYVDASTIRDDKFGRLAKHLFDRRNEYVQYVFEPMIRAKLMATSTQAIADDIVKNADGEIVKWPLRKQALTVTPAEKRLLSDHQLSVIDDISKNYPQLKSLLVKGDEEITTEYDTADLNDGDENKMADKDKNIVDSGEEIKAVNGRLDQIEQGLEKITTALEKIPAKTTHVVIEEDEIDKAVKAYPYKLGLQMQAVRAMTLNQELSQMQKAILGQNESVPTDGGFLVGSEQDGELMKKVHDTSVFASRINIRTITQGSNSVDMRGIKENSRATGSRFGGVQGYRVAEGQTITASQMKFYDFTVKPSEYAAVVYATNQVLRDTALLEQEINDNVPMELNFMLDDDILNGSAAGYPSGILNDNSLVTVAKESGQVAATIVKANILKMWSRLWSRSKSNAVWFVNQDCAPQLHDLEIGSGGSLMYRLPGSQGNESPFGTLLGRPVIETEFNATLGTVGDIVLADMSQYRLATIGNGVETASSIHVQFLTNQTAFRFTVPYDGQSSWETALTPYKGSNTVSPFVALATRS